jgi:hypothetical protein
MAAIYEKRGSVEAPVVTTEQDQLPLLAPRARKTRVELADTLCRRELTSWPRIVRTAGAEWVAGGAARYAQDLATAMEAIADRVADTVDVVESQMAELETAEAAQAKAARRAERAHAVPSVPLSQHEERLGGETARYRALEERLPAFVLSATPSFRERRGCALASTCAKP